MDLQNESITYHLIVSTNTDIVNTETDKFCFKLDDIVILGLEDFIFLKLLWSFYNFNHLRIHYPTALIVL